MKKILVFIVAALNFAACYDSETHSNDAGITISQEVPYVYTKQVLLEEKSFTYGQVSSIRHFTYNGHGYIQFHVCSGYSGSDGIVHDPDCKCGKGF